jgi:hypothetical protein
LPPRTGEAGRNSERGDNDPHDGDQTPEPLKSRDLLLQENNG